MLKKTLAIFVSAMLPISLYATVRPIFTLIGGAARVDSSSQQTLTLLPPFQNRYMDNTINHPAEIGGLVGLRIPLATDWQAEMGIAYYEFERMTPQGSINQFNDPDFNNLSYQYHLKNQRLLLTGKILTPAWQRIHTFMSAGAGVARNNSYAYRESALAENIAPMQSQFQSQHTDAFTYFVGIGAEVDVSTHIKLGFSYQFADLGKAQLGTSPIQVGNDKLTLTHLPANEFLFQLSYVG